jgi:PadR family transcriptional regulator, regulatory protein PadR
VEKLDQMRKGTTTLAILKLLVDTGEAMHGYQIARALESRSQGSFQFKEGLLYPRLHQMERDGLVCSEWEGQPSTRRRKVYRPTAEGKRRLDEELKQWQAFSMSMDRLLGLLG